MPLDPRLMTDTAAWLRRAANDLRAVQADMAVAPALLGDAAFHCQQSAEKVLKAFLTWHDIQFRRPHDLAELGQQAVALDVSMEPVCRAAERLSVYAWAFRYPGDTEEPDLADVEEGLVVARALYEAVLSRLPTEVHP
jgi:HEPN domain-containing protein